MVHIVCTCWFVSEVHCAFQRYPRGYLMYSCKLCTCCSHRVLRRVPRRSHAHTHVCAVRHACLCAWSTHVSPSPHVLPPVDSLGLRAHARVGATRCSCLESKSTHLSPSPHVLRPAVLPACARTRVSHSPHVLSRRAQTLQPTAACAPIQGAKAAGLERPHRRYEGDGLQSGWQQLQVLEPRIGRY